MRVRLLSEPAKGQVPSWLKAPPQSWLLARDGVDDLTVVGVGPTCLEKLPAVADKPVVEQLRSGGAQVEKVLENDVLI